MSSSLHFTLKTVVRFDQVLGVDCCHKSCKLTRSSRQPTAGSALEYLKTLLQLLHKDNPCMFRKVPPIPFMSIAQNAASEDVQNLQGARSPRRRLQATRASPPTWTENKQARAHDAGNAYVFVAIGVEATATIGISSSIGFISCKRAAGNENNATL